MRQYITAPQRQADNNAAATTMDSYANKAKLSRVRIHNHGKCG